MTKANNPILKKFVIKDDETAKRLIEIMESPSTIKYDPTQTRILNSHDINFFELVEYLNRTGKRFEDLTDVEIERFQKKRPE